MALILLDKEYSCALARPHISKNTANDGSVLFCCNGVILLKDPRKGCVLPVGEILVGEI